MYRVGGYGHVMSDQGSAYDIARRGLTAVADHFDRTGRVGLLGERVLRAGLAAVPRPDDAPTPLRVVMLSGSEEYQSDQSLDQFRDWLEARYPIRATVLIETILATFEMLPALLSKTTPLKTAMNTRAMRSISTAIRTNTRRQLAIAT
mgnify:CR=1 FL=1